MSYAVESRLMATSQLEKVTNLLGSIGFPGTVVSGSGEIIGLNEQMKSVVNRGVDENHIRCTWANDAACSDCAEKPSLEGRCFVSRESELMPLLAAIRIQDADNALIRIYFTNEEKTIDKTEDIFGRLLEIASPANKSSDQIASPNSNQDGLEQVNLFNLVESVSQTPELEKLIINNSVEKNQIIDSTSPIILGQMILNILLEFGRLKLGGSIFIRNMKQAGQSNEHISHLLLFQMKSFRSLSKSKSSELTAMGLRLKVFCKKLVQATGLKVEPPLVFCENDLVETRFSFPNHLEKTGVLPSFADDYRYRHLSAREREIVEMVRSGYNNMGISERLGITHATVKQHLKAIFRKVGVKNRIELIFINSHP